MEDYLTGKREVEGPTTERDCTLKGMTNQFSGVQNLYQSKGNQSLHIIQSWSPTESKFLTREQVHSMGVTLVERFAPGHQFVVQTHTEEAHSHNHIVVNPVSIETGKRIHNKKRNLSTLRDLNDTIAKENGLSVLPPQDIRARREGMSDKVKRIENYRGKSYIVDLANKGNFARQYATNYDEYVALLGALDIQVRIEPKNITYFYPGREHGKRGRSLTPDLDKPGLERRFQTNREKLDLVPESKRNLAELAQKYRGRTDVPTSDDMGASPASALVSHRIEGITQSRKAQLDQSSIPIEEIRNAKTQSILRYCAKEGVGLATDQNGKRVLKGREYVEVSDYSWINHRNKTRGNLIDFVANHKDVGFLQAIAQINNNPKLLLLEQYLGESKKHFQSFHVPKEDAAPRAEALSHLARLLGHSPRHPVYAELFKQQRVHVSNQGAVFFQASKSNDGYVEYTPTKQGGYQRIRKGQPGGVFWESKAKATELQLFLDPRTFLTREPGAFVGNRSKGVAALFEPDLQAAHRAISRHPNLTKVQVIPSASDRGSDQVANFFIALTDSLNPFSISTELAWEPVQRPDPSGQPLDVGLNRGLHER